MQFNVISSAIWSRIFECKNKSNIHSLKRREQGGGENFLARFSLFLTLHLICIYNIFNRLTYLLTNHGLYNRVNQRVNRRAIVFVNCCIIAIYLF